MRTRIHGNTRGLTRRVLREAIWFYADELKFKPHTQVHLWFSSKFPRSTGAEMWQQSNKNHYTIRCSSKNGPYKTLQDLAHEFLHVEQFQSGVMAENRKGTAWKGRLYRGDFMKQNDAYYNAPWEIDANGRSYWLYKRCRLHLLRCGFRLRK